LPGIALVWPKPEKILGQRGIGNQPSDIGEGKTGSTFHDFTPLQISVDTIQVDPLVGL